MIKTIEVATLYNETMNKKYKSRKSSSSSKSY